MAFVFNMCIIFSLFWLEDKITIFGSGRGWGITQYTQYWELHTYNQTSSKFMTS